MALALAQYEDLFQLVSGYLYWRKNGLPNQVWMMNTNDMDDEDAH